MATTLPPDHPEVGDGRLSLVEQIDAHRVVQAIAYGDNLNDLHTLGAADQAYAVAN